MAWIRCNPTLSDDLINEILVRLPVKSLVRFESVSKTWLSLIKHPYFVKSQLLRAVETDQTLIIKRGSRDENVSLLHVGSRQIVAHFELPYPRGESEETCRSTLVGSANGIVCVYYTFNTRATSIFLWNPAIRQNKLIPWYSDPTKFNKGLGFGYDPTDDDYKVVRVGTWSHFFAEVYSANRNVWRKVADPIVDIPSCNFDVCVNGFLCSIGEYGMIAFDLNKEVLNCAIELPFILDEDDDEDCTRVIEFNKCISVIDLIHIKQCDGESDDESDDKIDLIYNVKINVWTLDDDACLRGGGVEASWTPMFSIDLESPTELYSHYFCSGDFFLLLTDDEEMWILRNADMKEFKIVPLSVDVAGQLYHCYKYTESLVSLAGFRRVNWNAGE